MVNRLGVHALVWVPGWSAQECDQALFEKPVLRCGDRLGYVHIGESHRGYLGSGTIRFADFFRALARAGYGAPIAFESYSSAVISSEFYSSLGVWRDLWSDGRDLARHAHRFMEVALGAARRAVA
jgi:D-psicose/D-tagatose/L-ribulose 3-epimerase